MMSEVSRISGSLRVATKFKFDPKNVNVQDHYIACDFPKLTGSLKESEETLQKAKVDFAKWLLTNGILNKRGEKGKFKSVQDILNGINWEVETDGNYLVIGIRLQEIGLTKEDVKKKMEGKDLLDREEQNAEIDRQEKENKALSADQFRMKNGRMIMEKILENWNN